MCQNDIQNDKKQEKENEQRLSLTHKKHDSVIVITKDNNRIKGSITFRVFMHKDTVLFCFNKVQSKVDTEFDIKI